MAMLIVGNVGADDDFEEDTMSMVSVTSLKLAMVIYRLAG